MLAFIVNQFPRQVDAYFLRELVGLSESGLDFTIYSLLPPPRGWKVHADAKPLLARTVYPPALPQLVACAAQSALMRPAATAQGVARIVVGHRSMPFALIKSLAIVPQSLAFAIDMRNRGVRHIHANWATYPGTAAFLISRLSGIPYSFSGHATDIFVHRAMLEEKIAGAAFVVTCTRFNRDYLAGMAAPGAPIRSVHHGIDLERFARNGIPREKNLIITVGTLRACKGIPELIQSVKILRDRGRTVRLEIIGEGEQRPELERLIEAFELADRVRLVGYLPQEELIPIYQRASLVALPAHREDHFGIPNILIEGLAARTPVVTTELPSLGELIEHGKSGLFVPERDPVALADAIQRVLEDPAQAGAMAERGHAKVVEEFDMRRTVDELKSLFSAAVNSSPVAGGAAGAVAGGAAGAVD